MRHSLVLVVVIAATVWGARISPVAAQAGDELPPPPPDTNAPPPANTMPPPNAPAPGTQPAAAPAANPQLASIYTAGAPMPVVDKTRTAKNGLFVELLGNGLFYSLNYERFVTDDIAIRGGIGYFSLSASGSSASASASILSVPLMFEYMGIGSADDKLELGIGPLIFYASAAASGIGDTTKGSGTFLFGTATIGYRHIPHDGGFNFKIGFTPIFGKFGFVPYLPGIGAGAVF